MHIKYCLLFVSLLSLHGSLLAQPVDGYWEGYISHLGQRWKVGVEFQTEKLESEVLVDFIEISGYQRVFSLKHEGERAVF